MNTIDYEKTGILIQEARKAKGMTQLQLAEVLGVTDRAVSKWERGKSFPDVGILQDLAKELDLSVSELLDGEFSKPEKRGAEGPTVDELILKGMKSHLEVMKKAKREHGRKIGIVLLLLIMVSVYPAYKFLHRPVNFEKSIPDYDVVTIATDHGQSLSAPLNGEAGQELRDRILPILREIKSEDRKNMTDNSQNGGSIYAPYVDLGNVACFMPEHYYDTRNQNAYTFTAVSDVYEKLYSLCYDYVMDYNFEHWGNRDYEYVGETEFTNGRSTVSLNCDFTEYPQELILEKLKTDMDRVIDPSKPDAYIKEMKLYKIRRVYPEEYETAFEYKALQKEIDYYEIFDFRIYEAHVDFSYTEAYKAMGPQNPEGTRKIWYMVGKKYDATEYELCYEINMGFVEDESE